MGEAITIEDDDDEEEAEAGVNGAAVAAAGAAAAGGEEGYVEVVGEEGEEGFVEQLEEEEEEEPHGAGGTVRAWDGGEGGDGQPEAKRPRSSLEGYVEEEEAAADAVGVAGGVELEGVFEEEGEGGGGGGGAVEEQAEG